MMAILTPWLEIAGTFFRTFSVQLGAFGIFLIAIADSSFLTIPEANDLLIVVLSSGGSWAKMCVYVLVTAAGSVLGCLLLYSAGRKGGSPILRRKISQQKIEKAELLFARYGMVAVFVPSLLPPPCPFKIFVLCAGVFRLNIFKFSLAVVAGRTLRYFMWGVLAVLYGNPVKLYIQKNLPAVGIILALCFLTIILVFVMSLVRAERRKKSGSKGAGMSGK